MSQSIIMDQPQVTIYYAKPLHPLLGSASSSQPGLYLMIPPKNDRTTVASQQLRQINSATPLQVLSALSQLHSFELVYHLPEKDTKIRPGRYMATWVSVTRAQDHQVELVGDMLWVCASARDHQALVESLIGSNLGQINDVAIKLEPPTHGWDQQAQDGKEAQAKAQAKEFDEVRQQLKTTSQELAAVREQLNDKQDELNTKLQELAAVREQLNDKQELAAVREQLKTTSQELDAVRQQLADKQDKLNTKSQELAAVRAQLNTQLQELDALREQLNTKSQDLAAVRKQLNTQSQDLASLRQQVSDKDREIVAKRAQRDTWETKHDIVQTGLDAVRLGLDAVKDDLAASQRELAAAQDSLQAKQESLIHLRSHPSCTTIHTARINGILVEHQLPTTTTHEMAAISHRLGNVGPATLVCLALLLRHRKQQWPNIQAIDMHDRIEVECARLIMGDTSKIRDACDMAVEVLCEGTHEEYLAAKILIRAIVFCSSATSFTKRRAYLFKFGLAPTALDLRYLAKKIGEQDLLKDKESVLAFMVDESKCEFGGRGWHGT